MVPYDNKFFSPLSFVAVFGSRIRDPGSGMGKNQDPGSVINIPDWQHCTFASFLKDKKVKISYKQYKRRLFPYYRIRNACTSTTLLKDKIIKKKLQNSLNQGFSYYFRLMMEGSEAGYILVTNVSGFRSGSSTLLLTTAQ
jgi:hypothetical protein